MGIIPQEENDMNAFNNDSVLIPNKKGLANFEDNQDPVHFNNVNGVNWTIEHPDAEPSTSFKLVIEYNPEKGYSIIKQGPDDRWCVSISGQNPDGESWDV